MIYYRTITLKKGCDKCGTQFMEITGNSERK
jgi:hypothetical protein